jgi:inhibitor of KinA
MKIGPLGDSAVVVTLGETLDAVTVAAAQRLAAALEAKPLVGLVECATANVSVTVLYDPVRLLKKGGPSPYERVCEWIESRAAEADPQPPDPGREIVVPVCYGGEFGPDLAAVGAEHGLTADEVVALHSGAEYRVSAVGFTPGFPYLAGMPARLQTPRRKTPRIRVAAGSVAIGGAQTGIYSFVTPGGWNLIGWTPWRLFNPHAQRPALLQVGDRVRFQPIVPDEYGSARSP